MVDFIDGSAGPDLAGFWSLPGLGFSFFAFGFRALGGVPREQKMLKGHLPRVIYHQAY